MTAILDGIFQVPVVNGEVGKFMAIPGNDGFPVNAWTPLAIMVTGCVRI
jgi:hypothetical protein